MWFELLFAIVLIYLVLRMCSRDKTKRTSSTFSPIVDKYSTLDQVTSALRREGLESSNLILGIDFTKSNEDQGRYSFGGKSLHHVSNFEKNPYQEVIEIIGRTLEQFDDDRMIPAFGFGDLFTRDTSVFPFCPEDNSSRYCHGFQEVLHVYNTIVQRVQLSGPTNWAPLIRRAVEIVCERGRKDYHILVMITDGQVVNKRETEEAIVYASSYPLSIVCVGVGDGPWSDMERFDDELPQRRFDNFQFVNYHRTMLEAKERDIPRDVAFAVAALQEIPDQYRAIKELNLL